MGTYVRNIHQVYTYMHILIIKLSVRGIRKEAGHEHTVINTDISYDAT